MSDKAYWNRPNTVEFFAFMTKLCIIFPGLLLGRQWWWLYIFALVSSLALIWSSTKKTLPSIILFNIGWSILATIAILKYWIQLENKIRKGRDIEDLNKIVDLTVKTKCPSKWILTDTETGQIYKGNPDGYWDRLEPIKNKEQRWLSI